ncbi:hypothetical protein FOL47_002613 [Perkinsus chesapeaki]|uniref:Uncharacterized protein n=1 Tax=Perkinsus chesapeaki TaxID=330153 RepID=A0A7J6MCM2_PERCH|nr:hypothetical protein FOL47_002613 [Perkinsus chesapeaki]
MRFSGIHELARMLVERRTSGLGEKMVIVAHPDGLRAALEGIEILMDDVVGDVDIWYASRAGEQSPDIIEVMWTLAAIEFDRPEDCWLVLDDKCLGGNIDRQRAIALMGGKLTSPLFEGARIS